MPHQYLNPVSWPDIADSKFASLIQSQPDGCQVALIGIPDDTGVGLNNGRLGAKEGPAALRMALAQYGVSDPNGWNWPKVFDAGDVKIVPGDLHETHRRVTESTKALLEHGLFPIAIGGGHDLTFPFVRAVAQHFGPLDGVYFDAHLDVRETDGSGMPFRKLLENGHAQSMRIHGFDPYANTNEHVSWFTNHGGTIDFTSTPDSPWPDNNTFVSLDLDVIDQAHAPGVSAHNACGWSSSQCEAWVYQAGRNPLVRCFDMMELSPPYDRDDRTARIAARMFLTFLRGLNERAES